MNQYINHKENNQDFSLGKSRIFIEKIMIFTEKIEIFAEKIIKTIIKKRIKKLPTSLPAGF